MPTNPQASRVLVVNNDGNPVPVSSGYLFNNITSATTTVVKSGAGILGHIVINKAVADETVTIYDNTAGSGTKIGTITFPASLLASQGSLDYGVRFSTGLTIVTSDTVDMTVTYL